MIKANETYSTAHEQKPGCPTDAPCPLPSALCPLPSEAVKILKELQTITGDKDNVFHRDNVNNRIAIDVSRKNLQSAWGSKDVIAYGTRHSLKTWTLEVGYRKELSEMQLSREEQAVEAVYLRDRKIMT